MKVFLDSNIPMYVSGAEHPNREPSIRLLEEVRTGAVDACTSTEVLQEILHRYSAIGKLKMVGEVYNLFVEICPVVLDVTLADTDRACDLLLKVKGISSRDAIHAAVMLNNDIHRIATFDKGFDAVPRIKRITL